MDTHTTRDTVTVTLVNVKCACDEWVMCPTHEAQNDAVVAGQDMFTTMMGEAGITRMARHYRTYRSEVAAAGSLDAQLERYELFTAMVSERPCTAPIDPMARRWNRTRTARTAPADASLTDSPVAVTDRSKRTW
jgi:hypothetical protein